VPCACIDIGSNTTRLLVAEADGAGLRRLGEERAFTRIGRDLLADGRIGPAKVEEVAGVVAAQAEQARAAGAHAIRAVATAAIRDAANDEDLLAAVRTASGLTVEVLAPEEEARLAFLGATAMLGGEMTLPVGVVDVGGGSSELVVGVPGRDPDWIASLRIGSGTLADVYLESDPPTAAELEALGYHVRAVFEAVHAPRPALAVAVGGSATSLSRLFGGQLSPERLERALALLAAEPVAVVAQRFDLDAERVRLLPAGILILSEASARLGRPLQIGNGGLREGVVLELLGR
jgi:exopolyphosphatase / guanosine-5'-triphosphate,3'-diphosphate pyrophosphatase